MKIECTQEEWSNLINLFEEWCDISEVFNFPFFTCTAKSFHGEVKIDGKFITINPPEFIPIPEYSPTFEEISKQMRINIDILKHEITEHVDNELKRFKDGME